MNIWKYDESVSRPWANGRGLTRELAVAHAFGQIAWRMSVAEINSDGAFSTFPGKVRWHTIIEGAGLTLQNADDVLRADLFVPLFFDGGVPYHATLNDGPCRAFNIIFDPNFFTVAIDVHVDQQTLQVHPGEIAFIASGRARTTEGIFLGAGDAIKQDQTMELFPLTGSSILRVRLAKA